MLTVVTGPMFAGKTKWLIEWCNIGEGIGQAIQVLRPEKDNRHRSERILSHDGEEFPALIVKNDLKGVPTDDPFIDAFVFDEAQFFSPNRLVEVVKDLLFNKNKGVLIAGLCQDTFGNNFGAMPTLLCMADNIVHLKANCSRCNTSQIATRTYRKIKSKEQTVVGGLDMYEPRCFRCWRENDANTSKDPEVSI